MEQIKLQEQQTTDDTQYGKYLTFCLDKEVFGIEICYVTEIVGMQPFTKLPDAPTYVRGIINLRGRIIPVTDMRLRFGFEQIPYSERTCIVVVDINEISAGLIVDTVAEVVQILDDNIVPTPDKMTGHRNRYIRGIGKMGEEVSLLLDIAQLFGKEILNSKENVS